MTVFAFSIVAAVVLAVGGWAAWVSLRHTKNDKEPIITATLNELHKGWYHVTISVTNRRPHGFVAISLRRVSPRSVRILAPVTSVSTKEGDFQVWSDPASDRPATTIPLDTMIRPYQARQEVAPNCQSQISAWLFVPKIRANGRVTLELTLVGPDERSYRHRFSPKHEVKGGEAAHSSIQVPKGDANPGARTGQ
jgi:hypothetical protein